MTPMHPTVDVADHLDIGKYAATIGRRWKLVLTITIVAVVVVAIASIVLSQVTPRYQSTITVLLTGPRYKITFDPKFANADPSTAPAASRVDEYRAIATSPEVRLATIQALNGQLSSKEADAISGSVQVKGQLVVVTATSADPARATQIGTAYANAVAARLDAIYGQTDQDRQTIAKQVADAVATHQQAQDALTAFTRTSRVDSLSVQIAQKEAVMQSLAEERASFVKNRLAGYYGTLTDADQIIRAANGLRDQVQSAASTSTPAAGASLSLATLQSRLASLGTETDDVHISLSRDSHTTSDRTPASTSDRLPTSAGGAAGNAPALLQLQLNADALARTDADPQVLLASIDTLIASAKAQQADVRHSIDMLAQQVASGGATEEGQSLDATIAQLANELDGMQADYKQQTFQRDVLTQNVEQARSTRTTLEAKLSEASVSADTGGAAIVVSGAESDLPRSFPPSLSRSLPLTAVVALLVGMIVAILTARTQARPSAPKEAVESTPPTPAAAAR